MEKQSHPSTYSESQPIQMNTARLSEPGTTNKHKKNPAQDLLWALNIKLITLMMFILRNKLSIRIQFCPIDAHQYVCHILRNRSISFAL